ncbi:MAG: TonB-dependent receptor plug domain-containing protein [Bacteroidales bacterium]|jgi:iron complex outermembrane receptor protein|nr:TonB-dependent receptor plug domain-containing protein [Bacteroidales bacterium]
MKRLALLCGVFFSPLLVLAQQNGQKEKTLINKLDSVVVEAWRAGKNTPVSHSELGPEEVRRLSPVQSVPMALSLLPSVVTSTEGGNGLGYSSMRVRGSDGSRTNVTVNGIAMNDAESQEVFWVNIPAFSSFIQDIQLQRGVGTSSNGPGAFGASLNLRTLFTSPDSYGIAEIGAGSFSSYTSSVGAGTGLRPSGLSFDIRYSRSMGKGYIRNAKSDLSSLFATAGWFKGKTAIRLNYIYGDQATGITWEGVSREMMEIDRRYNPAGLYHDEAGNPRYYENETDNYTQHHVQMLITRELSEGLTWNNVLHYTNGAGYYENYKENRKFSEYGITPQLIDEKEYKRSDVIVRQALENDYYAISSTLQYSKGAVKGTGGIAYSYYDGAHFGNLIWSMWNQSIPDDYEWYYNNGFKGDFSVFARAELNVTKNLIAFADIQYRSINYSLIGEDKDFVSLEYNMRYNFFNPKVGLTYNTGSSKFFISASIGRKEPGRADIKESIKAGKADLIKPERLLDFEGGYSYSDNNFSLSANVYFMEYKDQLVPTGRLSETGYVIKENVPVSFRRGVEFAAAWSPVSILKLEGNLSLSINKIKNYTHWTDLYDNQDEWNPLPQMSEFFESTNLPYSPSSVGMGMVTLLPTTSSSVSIYGKHVGKQYYDNTSNEDRSVPAYFTMGLKGIKNFKIKGSSELELGLFVDNILNSKYFSNAWVYMAKFADGSTPYVEEGLYPQAGINFMLKATFRF